MVHLNFIEYHGSKLCTGSVFSPYLFHNFDVAGWIEFKGQRLDIQLQNGHSYYGNNYGCPTNYFDIYKDGCDRAIQLAYRFHGFDWANLDDDDLEELKECDIESEADLATLNELINDAINEAEQMMHDWLRQARFYELILPELECTDYYMDRDDQAKLIRSYRVTWQEEQRYLFKS